MSYIKKKERIMKKKKVGRRHFPPIYRDPQRELVFGFSELAGFVPARKDLSDIPCEVVAYAFPTQKEAQRFYEGVMNHPLHDWDAVGLAWWENFVLVASYDSEEDTKTFYRVLP